MSSPRVRLAPVLRGRRSALKVSFMCALLVHLAIAALVQFPSVADAITSAGAVIELFPITEEPPAPLPAESDDRVSRRIVEIPVHLNTDDPDEARFVSEDAQTVPEETRSWVQSDSPPSPFPLSADTPTEGRRVDIPAPDRKTEPGAPEPEKTPPLPSADTGSLVLEDLYPTYEEYRALIASSSMGKPTGHSARPSGSVGSRNYLPELRPDQVELINAKSYKYASFVRRVAIRTFNHFLARARTQVTYAELMSLRRSAVVSILMDSDGNVAKVTLIEPSGTYHWDTAAVDAANVGTWDRNVPKGTLKEDGYVHFIFAPGPRVLRAGIL